MNKIKGYLGIASIILLTSWGVDASTQKCRNSEPTPTSSTTCAQCWFNGQAEAFAIVHYTDSNNISQTMTFDYNNITSSVIDSLNIEGGGGSITGIRISCTKSSSASSCASGAYIDTSLLENGTTPCSTASQDCSQDAYYRVELMAWHLCSLSLSNGINATFVASEMCTQICNPTTPYNKKLYKK